MGHRWDAPPAQRGTREQFLLARRSGLILELGQHLERLPVIVDEAPVNSTRPPAPDKDMYFDQSPFPLMG